MPEILLPTAPSKGEKYTPQGVKQQMPFALGLKRDGSDLWWLPYEPEVSYDLANDIIYRAVAHRRGRGTVKEFFALGDYRIEVTGIFISTDESYPEANVRKLKELCNAPQALLVSSELTTLLNVGLVVVERMKLEPAKGNTQSFVLSLISDQEEELF